MTAKAKLLEPIHPGEILLEDFMKPTERGVTERGVTQNVGSGLAK